MKIPRYTKRSMLGLGLVGILAFNLANSRGVPASEGITNFGKVSDVLYRGAQPDAAAVEHLKALGIKTIISLRTTAENSGNEQARALACGLVYTNVPFDGIARPTDEQVAKVLALIENSSGPVFVHCQHGCDRTGTIIACYRLAHDHWSADAALAEAHKYGMSRLEIGMHHYIVDFANALNAKRKLPPQ